MLTLFTPGTPLPLQSAGDNEDDLHYKSLQCDMNPVDVVRAAHDYVLWYHFFASSSVSHAFPAFALQKSNEFKVIEEYIKTTASHGKLLDVFEISRHGADKRFDAHKVYQWRLLTRSDATSPPIAPPLFRGGGG
jgi:hypothetical protein